MALQSVAAVSVNDPLNPTELATWFQQNPLAVITTIVIHRNVFYIVHT
jgi:hypothetical protein